MNIEKQYEVEFDTDDSIMTVTMSKVNEIVMLLSSGNVVRYDFDKQDGEALFSVISRFTPSDGGFDITDKSSIYTIDEIVVVVNDFKRHGFIHYPGNFRALNIWRGEYYADISCYPIALFKDEKEVPYIIYGADWNHVQIMNLNTRQILTAAKSLIIENAEEKYIEANKKYPEENKLAWPLPYDYFFGKLQMSPDKKHFLSAGWSWGSCDAFNIYNTQKFIKSNRISEINIGYWEHENRAVCWISHNKIAIAYNPLTEGDETANQTTPNEIHFYELVDEKTELIGKVKVENIDLVTADIQFSNALNSIVAYSDKIGIAVISLEGEVLYHNNELKVNNYCSDTNQFIMIKDNILMIHKLNK